MNWTLQFNAKPRTAPAITLSLPLAGSGAFFFPQPAVAAVPDGLRLEVFTAEANTCGVATIP